MTYQTAAVLTQLLALKQQGFEGMANAIQLLINEQMII